MTEFRVVIDRGDGVQDEIATWLDKEWIPRDIHREIGEAAGSVVLEAREEGMHDASGILFKVSSQHSTTQCCISNSFALWVLCTSVLLKTPAKQMARFFEAGCAF